MCALNRRPIRRLFVSFADSIVEHRGDLGVDIITAFVTNPATAMAMALAKVKEQTGSNKPLLQPDPTQPGKRQILGVPLLTCPSVTTTNSPVWAIPAAQTFFVVREQAEVESDRSVFFTGHRVAVRAIVRAGFAYPNPPAIVKISTTSWSR